MLEFETSAGTSQNGMKPLSLGANIGYRFVPRVYAFLHSENMYAHYDVDGVRTYNCPYNLGGGLGYTFYNDDVTELDLRGHVSTSLGNSNWKNVTYDAGVVMKIGRDRLKMNVGISFRHVNSRSAGIKSYNGVMFTIGFGI